MKKAETPGLRSSYVSQLRSALRPRGGATFVEACFAVSQLKDSKESK
jgi:hypothetical protein